MRSQAELEREIESIKERNAKVEADKAWETSLFRKVVISIFTYAVVVLFFHFAGLPDPFINAIVPSLAFVISTLSLPLLKGFWIEKFYKRK